MAVNRKTRHTTPALAPTSLVDQLDESVAAHLIAQSQPSRNVRALFTAPSTGCGTTLITIACGAALVRATGHDVLMIECPSQRQALASRCAIEGGHDLMDVLMGEVTLAEARRPVAGCAGLFTLPAGPDGMGLLNLLAADSSLERLAAIFEDKQYVLVDAPPLRQSPIARTMLQLAQQCVLIARARQTTTVEIEQTAKLVSTIGARTLGTILNRFKSDVPFGGPR